MKAIIFSIGMLLLNQANADDLNSALSTAIQEANEEHALKQVALQVAPSQVEVAKFRKNQDPQVVQVHSTATMDKTDYSTKHLADEVEVEDVDEGSAIGQELLEDLGDNGE